MRKLPPGRLATAIAPGVAMCHLEDLVFKVRGSETVWPPRFSPARGKGGATPDAANRRNLSRDEAVTCAWLCRSRADCRVLPLSTSGGCCRRFGARLLRP